MYIKDRNSIDYKKLFFEKQLNKHKSDANVNRLYKVMRRYGYHYELDNGHYYVYTSYEWKVKKHFDTTIAPMLECLYGDDVE